MPRATAQAFVPCSTPASLHDWNCSCVLWTTHHSAQFSPLVSLSICERLRAAVGSLSSFGIASVFWAVQCHMFPTSSCLQGSQCSGHKHNFSSGSLGCPCAFKFPLSMMALVGPACWPSDFFAWQRSVFRTAETCQESTATSPKRERACFAN